MFFLVSRKWRIVTGGGGRWDPIRVVLLVLVDPIRMVQTEVAALDTALVH